jgi:hypothetical protein
MKISKGANYRSGELVETSGPWELRLLPNGEYRKVAMQFPFLNYPATLKSWELTKKH